MNDILNGACDFLVLYGYLAHDHNVQSWNDMVLKTAMSQYQKMDANVAKYKEESGGLLVSDGEIGPATMMAMSMPRCGCKDVDDILPALGTGGWKNCHQADGFHKAIVYVNKNNQPSFLSTSVFKEILTNVQTSYAKMGLLFVFIDSDRIDILTGERVEGSVNIDFSFTIGNGWIGLAIVGSNQSCSSRIWCRYHYRYSPSNIVREWTTLIKHELGHNTGLRHSSGGVMNPSIMRGLPTLWPTSDPSYSILKRWFGGDNVPNPEPPSPPVPPSNWKIGRPVGDAFDLINGERVQLYSVPRG